MSMAGSQTAKQACQEGMPHLQQNFQTMKDLNSCICFATESTSFGTLICFDNKQITASLFTYQSQPVI